MSTTYIYKCDICDTQVDSSDDLYKIGLKPRSGDMFWHYSLSSCIEEDVCFDCQNTILSLVDDLRYNKCKI